MNGETKDAIAATAIGLLRGAVTGDVLAGKPATRDLFRDTVAAWDAACKSEEAAAKSEAECVIERARRGHA